MKYHRKLLAIAWLFFLAAVVPVNARQINGTPGSPGATQSINGQVLAAPALIFQWRDQPQRQPVQDVRISLNSLWTTAK